MNQKGNVLLIVLLIAAAIGGYLIYQNYSKASVFLQQTTQSLPIADKLLDQNQTDETIKLAQKDLANLLSTPIDEIQIIKSEKVIWPDTCLGLEAQTNCGVKADVAGYKVVFKALDQQYKYHTGGEYYRYAGPGKSPQRF